MSKIVVHGASIVSTYDGSIRANRSILIEGGRIAKIGFPDAVSTLDAEIVDARGKFAVPGYWDMHAHVFDSSDIASDCALMLANGVTGVRQMSGSDELLAQRAAGAFERMSNSPELLAMPGRILLRNAAGSAAQAVAEIDHQGAAGADFIKVVDLDGDVFFSALEAARAKQLPYVGHLPAGVDAVKASAAGMRTIEHLGSPEIMLISCSTDENAIRQEAVERMSSPNAASTTPAPLGKEGIYNPILTRASLDPASIRRMQHVIDTFSEEKCRKMAAIFVRHETWQTPTLNRLRSSELANAPEYASDPNLDYVPQSTRDAWMALREHFSEQIGAADQKTLRDLYTLQLRVAKILYECGVKLLAGSDYGGGWLAAGFSLHHEFDQLAAAGFSPLRVLQMATLNGAQFLGREHSDGSVSEDKNANLVLLDANPIERVQNLHGIDSIVRNGRFYSRVQLEALKAQARASASVASVDGHFVAPCC